jgi:hypothetical protein
MEYLKAMDCCELNLTHVQLLWDKFVFSKS